MANIVSFNVRGMAEVNKRRELFNFFRDKNADITLIQETHSSSKTSKIWKNERGVE